MVFYACPLYCFSSHVNLDMNFLNNIKYKYRGAGLQLRINLILVRIELPCVVEPNTIILVFYEFSKSI